MNTVQPEGSSRWPRERLIRVIRRTVLFVGLGIPGALVFVASCIMVSIIILSRTPLTSPDAVYWVIALPVSAFCLLLGAGYLRKWLYLTPFVVWVGAFFGLASLLSDTDPKGIEAGLLAAIPAFITHYLLKRHYARTEPKM